MEEGEGSLDFLYFGDGDFVRDAATLDYAEGNSKFAIAESDIAPFDEQCVFASISNLFLGVQRLGCTE